MNGKPWTAEQLEILDLEYADTRSDELAKKIGRELSSVYAMASKRGLKKSEAYLASPAACRLRRGDDIGAPYRFQKGHVPANKGLRRPGWHAGRMKETQFKKGQKPINAREIGDLRINSDGYVDMKISEAKGASAWRGLHLLLWEDEHGPLPEGFALCFKDRDKLNVCLDNIELVSRADLCRRNSIHNLPPELKSAINTLGALKRRYREKQDDRSARSPFRRAGRTSRLRQAVQR